MSTKRRAFAGQSPVLSVAKQVWSGKMDTVIKTIERNVRLI
jgi:hypothetical protein